MSSNSAFLASVYTCWTEPPGSDLSALALHFSRYPRPHYPNEVIRFVLIRDPALQVLVFLPRVLRDHGGHDHRQHTACSLSMAAHRKRMGCHSSACVSSFLSRMLLLILMCFGPHHRIVCTCHVLFPVSTLLFFPLPRSLWSTCGCLRDRTFPSRNAVLYHACLHVPLCLYER